MKTIKQYQFELYRFQLLPIDKNIQLNLVETQITDYETLVAEKNNLFSKILLNENIRLHSKKSQTVFKLEYHIDNYFIFRIGIKRNLIRNTEDFKTEEIENFDFNPAVITELLETEIVDSIVEVKKINSLSTFRIIPNPAKNIILVSFEKQNTGTIQIFNLSGQIVFEEGYLNQKELKISVQDLKKGIYIVRNKEENIIETTKFLVE